MLLIYADIFGARLINSQWQMPAAMRACSAIWAWAKKPKRKLAKPNAMSRKMGSVIFKIVIMMTI
ncbi:hypothetical protein HMPREF0476_1403 [Kingella kingae ATCC 23330]|uniref:Uncharacterized protein n=1 Tax=Kingella kingae ATCC 23330 TaxID=887327 RepID=F5S870_KINKI|nr:hypothetical protein HMPREF0476_1403 [Kingella kingae ATCC 23330]